MKLRNKKTGEIIEVESLDVYTPIEGIVDIPSFDRKGSYNSLSELNEEWEDYEEPKDHWHIGCEGDVFIDNTEGYLKSYSSIGNDFETKEEAEMAVEKLKAWKRLKDKEVKFEGWERDERYCGDYTIKMTDQSTCDDKDLDLLFGGEE